MHESNYLFTDSNIYDIYKNIDTILDDIMVSSTHTAPPKSVPALDLFKVWRIDLETITRTLELITHTIS